MRYQFLLFITILSFSIIFAGCGNSVQPVNNAANNNAANANTVAANNSNNLIQTNKKPEAETTNNAPTLAPVVTAYYDALKKKDEAAVRKVVSQDTLKVWEADMKTDKKSSLIAFLTENDVIPDKPMEVRNEKIEGNTGVAEIKGGSYGVWTPFKFVRENGDWKMTNQSPDIDDVKKSASPSNTAK
ncbi:MAG TPA: nuclear transport factor 2 family protein [Pyrinomonadaceae bacterium]